VHSPLCGFYFLWWFSFPLAEEPWLRERYGQEYESYAERVPRFVGRRTLWLWLGRDYGGK
jgi:protein-S-isoprenylcysteine O-methyltransferase Ste14